MTNQRLLYMVRAMCWMHYIDPFVRIRIGQNSSFAFPFCQTVPPISFG